MHKNCSIDNVQLAAVEILLRLKTTHCQCQNRETWLPSKATRSIAIFKTLNLK